MLLFSTTVLVLVGLIFCDPGLDSDVQKKKGGIDSAKIASDCFLQFSKIPRQNCGGGLLTTADEATFEKCAEKCYFEESDCQGFSFSKTNKPSCVIKSIRSCEKSAENYHTDSDYQFYTRVPKCSLLPSGTLYPSSNGCAFAEVSHSCEDMMHDCTTADCKTEAGCKARCLVDGKCHGCVFDPADQICSLWMGKNCTGVRANHNIQFYEKYCGQKLDAFEKKTLNKYKEQFQPRCPNLPRPALGLTRDGSMEIGAIHTFYCINGYTLKNTAPRQVICINTEDEPKWVPYMNPEIYGDHAPQVSMDELSDGCVPAVE